MSKSPFKTAIAVANSMVGSSLLVLPVNYLEKGIIHNSIGAVIMCVVMGSTATAIGTLVSGKVKEFFNVVKRQLGPNWSNVMAILGSILTTLVGCIIFLLASDILYEMFETFSDTISNMGGKLFKSLLLILFIPFCFLNNLELVVRFGLISMGLIWLYVFTILYSFIENIPNIDSGAFAAKDITLPNVQYWLAVQGFCFTCHPTLDHVLKQNKKSKTNGRSVIVGYLMSLIIMVSCGVLGALALYKKEKKKPDDNVIDYFIGHWQYYVLGISMCIYLLSIFPIFPFVSRVQVYEILPAKYKQNPTKTHRNMKFIFIGLFVVLNVAFILFETSPGAVMGFVATVVSFYICYLLPIIIKLKLLKRAEQLDVSQSKQSLIASVEYLANQNQSQDKQLLPTQQKNTRLLHKVGFISVLIFGSALMLGEIWTLIYNLFN